MIVSAALVVVWLDSIPITGHGKVVLWFYIVVANQQQTQVPCGLWGCYGSHVTCSLAYWNSTRCAMHSAQKTSV